MSSSKTKVGQNWYRLPFLLFRHWYFSPNLKGHHSINSMKLVSTFNDKNMTFEKSFGANCKKLVALIYVILLSLYMRYIICHRNWCLATTTYLILAASQIHSGNKRFWATDAGTGDRHVAVTGNWHTGIDEMVLKKHTGTRNLQRVRLFCSLYVLKPVLMNFKDCVPLNLTKRK
jgi:hypothetical protein